MALSLVMLTSLVLTLGLHAAAAESAEPKAVADFHAGIESDCWPKIDAWRHSDEAKAFMAEASLDAVPANSAVAECLGVFCNLPEIEELFNLKRPIIKDRGRFDSYVQRHRIYTQEEADVQWAMYRAEMQAYNANFTRLLNAAHDACVDTDYAFTIVQQDKAVLVFYFDRHPHYMIKAAKYHYPLRVAGPHHSKRHFPYHLLSRALYARELNQFLIDEAIAKVRPIQKYIFHIPGRPEVLDDKNFLVVAQRYPDTDEAIKKWLPALTYGVDDGITMARADNQAGDYAVNSDMVTELLKVITGVGLWSIDDENVLLLPSDGAVAFIDLERGGLGGFEPENWMFASKRSYKAGIDATSNTEYFRNSNSGTDGLRNSMNPAGKRNRMRLKRSEIEEIITPDSCAAPVAAVISGPIGGGSGGGAGGSGGSGD